MPSFEIRADIFIHLSVFDSPKGSSNTFKTRKNISLCFKRRELIIYNYCIDATKYWMHAIFKENELASYPFILHKANICGIDAITVLSHG